MARTSALRTDQSRSAVNGAPNQEIGRLIARLRECAAADESPAVAELAKWAAEALEQTTERLKALEEELSRVRQGGYKEVLAMRGQPHRPDGSPVWPLRREDFPSTHKEEAPVAPKQHEARAPTATEELPDWMR